MGYLDFTSPEVRRTASDSESQRFGFATDRMTVGDGIDLAQVAALVQEQLGQSTARLTILRFPSHLLGLVGRLDLPDARVYPAGSLVYWEAPAELTGFASGSVRDVAASEREAQSEALIHVLRDSFEGYVNHYSANPLIPAAVVVDGYAQWAASSIRSSQTRVFAQVLDGTTVGVAVVATTGLLWEIELASIATAHQGRGLYLELIAELVRTAAEEGARVVISTQVHNIGVQRAWAKLGFRPIASIDTVHIVRPSSPPAR